jgi:hypothetical protein
MRQLLIQALKFPRRYIRSSLFLLDCPHGGNFQQGDQRCESCSQKEACHWLYLNDECTNTRNKSVAQLTQSLEFPLDYIDTDIAHAGHNIGTCTCSTCLWLKNTENLLNLYQRAKRPTH